MFAWTFGLEASVYGLGLVEELSESFGEAGNTVERFSHFMNYSNTELSLVLCEILL